MTTESGSSRFDREWYARPTGVVARAMLGTIVVVRSGDGEVAGRIVETEAYLGESDAASHVNLYRRGRQALMRHAGHVYMYRAYGIHLMFNIITETAGIPGAVLVRAIEPVDGIEIMTARRSARRRDDLGRGPGNVAQALGLSLADDDLDLAESGRLWLSPGNPPRSIAVSTRIGITKNPDALLRFFDPESPAVSAHRRATLVEPVFRGSGTEPAEPPSLREK